jgi:hypothetical protein
MDCPHCKQPIITSVWECHTGQDFCSVECGMRFTHGRPIPRPILSLHALLGPKFRLTYNADDFAEEYFIGPFIVSNDILNGWLLFFNHKQYGHIHLADLTQLVSITKLVLKGEIQRTISFLAASLLDCVGAIVSRGHWTIGPLHIHCDDTESWSWETRTDTQRL